MPVSMQMSGWDQERQQKASQAKREQEARDQQNREKEARDQQNRDRQRDDARGQHQRDRQKEQAEEQRAREEERRQRANSFRDRHSGAGASTGQLLYPCRTDSISGCGHTPTTTWPWCLGELSCV